MPLGYKEAMDRWRAAPPSTCYPLLPSEIPSSSSPPSLLPSSSSPPPSLLPSSSRKRSISPSPSPPAEHIESVGDDIETLRASLASAMQQTMTLFARVRLLEQHDMEVREFREFRVTDILEILELHSLAEYAESRLDQSHDRQTGDGAHTQRTDMT
ncbi:hypothetical protein Tco_0988515 [Tanacetum coccineum]|uniref:Uncharacterized protein n=1 Tax=Tanacetum coccineum TaxID=301880 RepID=A0ABQ5ER47_9ASTR